MSERKREDARGRFRVGDLGDRAAFWKDLGIWKGAIIEVTEGFPEDLDMVDPPTVIMEVHPNIAAFLGELYEKGDLERVEEVADA